MIKLFSKNRKLIGRIILFVAIFYVAEGVNHSIWSGAWVLSEQYIPSDMNFDSRLAAADDLVGSMLTIYENNDEVICEWDEQIYELSESVPAVLDEVTFAKRYAMHSKIYLDNFLFPVKEFVFENERMEMPTVIILIDDKNKIFVRFNDQIGDLAIFPLKKK